MQKLSTYHSIQNKKTRTRRLSIQIDQVKENWIEVEVKGEIKVEVKVKVGTKNSDFKTTWIRIEQNKKWFSYER